MLGNVSVPVMRFTSVLPYATGAVTFWTSLENALEPADSPGSPPFASPQKIIMAPARMFSCLSMPSCWILEQSKSRRDQRIDGVAESVLLLLPLGDG
jgi:hypothetical protein